MHKLYFTLLVSLIISITANAQNYQSINLNDSWEFKSASSADWYPAEIPGSVHTDLFKNQLIQDPYKGTIEKELEWIDTTTWIYKTEFTKPKKLEENQKLQLIFHGLDTYADIYLNNKLVYSSNNMFLPAVIEISESELTKKNELKVIFHPTLKSEKETYNKLNYKLPEGSRAVTRKAAYQYGWDWAPKYLGAGIWQDVELIYFDEAQIKHIWYSTEDISSTKANLNLFVEIESDQDFKGKLYTISEENEIQETHELQIKKGTHSYKIDLGIDNPNLWWTHNLGEPYLYNFEISLENEKELVHSRTIDIGIRAIELVQEKDSLGKSFYFKLNGTPVYMKGANYVPQSSFPGSVKKEEYINLLNDVKSANMNMLRIWGGGIYEKDIFYELCNKEGILIWQDFMFANNMFPNDSSFLDKVQKEANYQVKRLSKNPCIGVWCGNNEIDEAWHNWGWSKSYSKKDSTEIWNTYLHVFRDLLPKTVETISSNTPYTSSSPLFGRGNPRSVNEGDNHYWYVWHDAYDFSWYNKVTGRFMSEFGFQSYPSMETINFFYPEIKKDKNSDVIAAHQKHHRGDYLISNYMKDYYPVPDDFEEFVYVSQLLQAEGIRTGILAQRRAKPFCMGSLYWQLNDCWPAISWSSIDYLGNWKALHYFAKQDYKNVILSPILEGTNLKVFGVSDSISIYDATLKINLIDFYGNRKFSKKLSVSINKSESRLVFEKDLSELLKKYNSKKHALIIEIEKGKNIFDKRIVYFENPKDLDLHKINVNFTVKKIKDGYQIKLKSTNLLKNLFIEIPAKGFWSNNFIDLLPREEVVLTFTTQEKINHIESKIKFTSLNHILNK